MGNIDNKENKTEKLYEIYEKFTEQIITNGWKGKLYGWEERIQNDGKSKQWMMFELGNGFCLVLNDPGEDGEEEASLEYWFENTDEEWAIAVESIEQLQKLLE